MTPNFKQNNKGRFLAPVKLQKRTTPRILKISGIFFACDREGTLALELYLKKSCKIFEWR